MTPKTVFFTGLELDPMPLLEGRVHHGVIPAHWLRVRWKPEDGVTEDRMNRWLYRNINGRWACWMIRHRGGEKTMEVAFESNKDAVMFKLKGGETVWADQTDPDE